MLSDLRQSEEWGRYLSSQGWKVEKLPITNYQLPIFIFIRRLPFYGSVIKIQRPKAIPPVEEIDKIAKRHHAFFVKLEPGVSKQRTANSEQLRGFERDPNPNLPTKTIIIDLTKSEEELWRDLSQDARQSIKKAEGTSFGFAESSALRRIRSESNQLLVISYRHGEGKFDEALKAFHQLLKRTGYRQRFWTPNLDQLRSKVGIFGKNSILFLAYPPSPRLGGATEGQVPPVSDQPIAGRLRRASPLAGALNLTHDGISHGCYAASADTGRKLHAPYLLLWEIIKRTKSSGLKALDLEGIYDPRYHKATKSWQGFTLFKRKFGGKEVAYPQPLIKYYHPVVKLVFKLGSLSN